eukprot:2417698-Amphidinium_carterae.2
MQSTSITSYSPHMSAGEPPGEQQESAGKHAGHYKLNVACQRAQFGTTQNTRRTGRWNGRSSYCEHTSHRLSDGETYYGFRPWTLMPRGVVCSSPLFAKAKPYCNQKDHSVRQKDAGISITPCAGFASCESATQKQKG